MSDLDLGINIDVHNMGARAGFLQTQVMMKRLSQEATKLNAQQKALSKVTASSTKEFHRLSSEMQGSGHAARALTLNFYELRSAIRNTTTRAAISGFSMVAAALNSLTTSAFAALGSLSNLAAAIGIGGAGGLAAGFQGLGVAALGFNNILKVLTTTGQQHQKALAKLIPVQREFVRALRPMRDLFRELQQIAPKGLFPGWIDALKRIEPLFGRIKQAVYDTALQVGYLTDRFAAMLGKRGYLIGKALENNVRLLNHYGKALENFGVGFLDMWVTAIPLMQFVARGVENFSKKFMEAMHGWRKDGSLREFFANFKQSFSNWANILGAFGKTFFNLWKASQPAVHRLERDIAAMFGHFADFTSKHAGEIQGIFIRGLRPLEAFAKLLGAVASTLFTIGEQGGDSLVRMFDGIRTKVLPIIEDLALILEERIVGSLGDAIGALLDFVHTAIPSLENLLRPLAAVASGFAQILRWASALVEFGQDKLGSFGGVLATYLSVTAIAATWAALRVQVAGVMGLLASPIGAARTGATRANSAMGVALRNPRQTIRNAQPIMSPWERERRTNLQTLRRQGPNYAGNMLYGSGSFRSTTVGAGSTPRIDNPLIYRTLMQPRTYYAPPATVRPPYPISNVPAFTSPAARRIQRQQEAAQRQAAYAALTPAERLAIANQRPGSAMRERGRIASQMGGPALKGGQGFAMFREYQATMEKSTKKGFLGGLKNMFSSGKGSAALGTLGALTGSVALGLAVPIVIAGIGALSIAMKDKRPKIVQEVSKAATNIGFTPNAKPGFNPRAQMQQNPLLKSLGGQLNVAIKDNDIEKIRRIRDEIGKLGATIKNVGQQDEIKHLTEDIGALAAQTSGKLLNSLIPDFQRFSGATKDSIDHIMDSLFVLKNQITAKLPVAGREYREAMGRAFAGAAADIQAGIDQGIINEKKGLREIHNLLMKEFKQLGFTQEEARHLSDPKNKSNDPTGKQGGNENPGGRARGGFVGGKGRVGRDSVPMNVDGRQIITAPGEYVGIFTRHQQRAFEERAGMPMGQFFDRHPTPHYASSGGIWKLGERIQQMQFAGAPYNVSENSHFGGVHPVHVKNSRHYTDEALDINHDNPAGSEPAALDSLASKLISEGWHVLWKVAGHFDHLHVDDATSGGLPGGGGGGGGAAKMLKNFKVDGMKGLIGGLVQGTLNQATSVANSVLGSLGTNEAGEGSIAPKGGGSAAANQTLAKSMLKSFGWGNSEWPSLQSLGMGESGWDANALNKSSGAYGIGQFLGGTKDAYAKWGATSKLPGRQISAMLHYIKDRYGSPSAAYSAWLSRSPHWYSAGGSPDPPPTTGNPVPGVDPGGAVTPGSSKPSKPKKKKKTRIAGGKPPLGAGIGANQFKPSSKKPKPKARKKIRELIGEAFTVKDPSFVDPITGEPLDIGTYGPLASISHLDNGIGNLSDLLDASVNNAGLTEEQAIVSLYDSDQYPDLTSYLKNVMGKDDAGVAEWIGKYGDSMDVINQSGMTVQGLPVRGITQAVAELTAQLAYHTSVPVNATGALKGVDARGMLGGLQLEQGIAKGIPSAQAVAERIKRLAQIKKIFEANVDLRKRYHTKLSKMKGGNYTWQEAVSHNSDLITSWQRWKRDSLNEPQVDTDQANHEMDRLKDLNKSLRKNKPKGRVYGSEEYQRTYETYAGRGIENRMLVGDKDAKEWDPQGAGGFTGKLTSALTNWRGIDSEKNQLLNSLPGQIATEQGNIASLTANIAEWTGTRITPAAINRAAPDTSTIDALTKENAMNNLRGALLGSVQFDVLKGFAQILGQRVLGSYAHGGLIPETGPYLLHRGENVTSDPKGPYGSNVNVNEGHTVVELHMRDKSGQLVELIDQRVRKVSTTHVSGATGRKTRRIAAAPGGRS